jgi:hypothetical protein
MPVPLQALSDAHDKAQQQFAMLGKAQQYLTKVIAALAPLEKLGYNVTQDDVLKASMPLVQNGTLPSRVLAAELATMPLQGPALADWIKQLVLKHQQQDQQVMQNKERARQNLSLTSMHMLAQLGGR